MIFHHKTTYLSACFHRQILMGARGKPAKAPAGCRQIKAARSGANKIPGTPTSEAGFIQPSAPRITSPNGEKTNASLHFYPTAVLAECIINLLYYS